MELDVLLRAKRCLQSELEALLRFCYLPQIAFESCESKEDVRARGVHKWQEGRVSPEALELGARFSGAVIAAALPACSLHFLGDEVGHGLFVEEEIKAGAFVGEYTGIVRKNDRRYLEPLNDYCYEYPVSDEIGRSFVIDATSGNLTRFINHSNCPNLRPVHIFFDGFYHLIFLALCDIAPSTQLTYNYGLNYWYVRRPPQEL
jgi:hypothetical protein